MMYYANPIILNISTTEIQPMYLGVSAVANTNLSLNLAISCNASSECTLTIKIELDNVEIVFKPKQKLKQGDNVIGIPLGIPQVNQGAHYVGIYLKVDTGTVTIPIYNMQCMIDGRNLQGGLSAEPAHAECFEKIEIIDINKLYINKVNHYFRDINLQETSTKLFTSSIGFDTTEIIGEKEIFTEVNITME